MPIKIDYTPVDALGQLSLAAGAAKGGGGARQAAGSMLNAKRQRSIARGQQGRAAAARLQSQREQAGFQAERDTRLHEQTMERTTFQANERNILQDNASFNRERETIARLKQTHAQAGQMQDAEVQAAARRDKAEIANIHKYTKEGSPERIAAMQQHALGSKLSEAIDRAKGNPMDEISIYDEESGLRYNKSNGRPMPTKASERADVNSTRMASMDKLASAYAKLAKSEKFPNGLEMSWDQFLQAYGPQQ